MKRALIIATVSGFVPQFEMSNVFLLQKLGYEVHCASNFHNPHYGIDNHRFKGSGILCHQIDFVRSPFELIENGKAYQQLKKLIETISFRIIHCHTPMGGVLGRMAANEIGKRVDFLEKNSQNKQRTKVLYTVHGFHFYQGAPLRNWMIYYIVEWYLARKTDILITINQEDYMRAKQFHLKEKGRVYKINGVGIFIEDYQHGETDKEKKRKEFGVLSEDYILISVGELTKRKNHQIVIKALARMKKEGIKKQICYLICGEGRERTRLTKLIQQNHLENSVFLLGYRTDIKELLAVSDCFIFPSKQEGLPVAVMEALAMGVPCICSDIRGNRDLIKENRNGILVRGNHEKAYKDAIQSLLDNPIKGVFIDEKYAKRNIEEQMKRIYYYAEIT